MYVSDTIAAIATASGAAGIGIVRISGPNARSVVSRLFRCRREVSRWKSHRLYRGRIVGAAGRLLDDAMAVLMARPHSYTGEDVVELHCHGSPVLLRAVLAEVLGCGARLAEPGEFTERAFLNGRMDLAQAEAVADLINARGDAAIDLALRQMSGNLSKDLADIRQDLIRFKALLEAQIDFSEEDFEIDAGELSRLASTCEAALDALVASFRAGRVARDGLRVVIVGKPNVGKSSLLNALLREDRAIVSAFPGTTRDTIEETVSFEGIPIVLTDTAGLRPAADADPVERIGIGRTAATLAAAQVGLLVFDASAPLDDDDRAVLAMPPTSPQLIAINKIDLPAFLDPSSLEPLRAGRPLVRISAKTGAGLEDLRRAIVERADAKFPIDAATPVITRLRHRDSLAKAAAAVGLARASIAERQPPDIIAVDVQDAIDRIGEVTGTITTDDILDRIFSDFCIGK
jgi:tRNA modification GTPase